MSGVEKRFEREPDEGKTKPDTEKPAYQSRDRYGGRSSRDRVAHERGALVEDPRRVAAIAGRDQLNLTVPASRPVRNEYEQLQVRASVRVQTFPGQPQTLHDSI